MDLRKFGDYYLNLDRITYAYRFQAPLGPALPGTTGKGGLRIFFDNQELTIYDDEAGFAELLEWFDSR